MASLCAGHQQYQEPPPLKSSFLGFGLQPALLWLIQSNFFHATFFHFLHKKRLQITTYDGCGKFGLSVGMTGLGLTGVSSAHRWHIV